MKRGQSPVASHWTAELLAVHAVVTARALAQVLRKRSCGSASSPRTTRREGQLAFIMRVFKQGVPKKSQLRVPGRYPPRSLHFPEPDFATVWQSSQPTAERQLAELLRRVP